MKKDITYKFNVINMEKSHSEYNAGMKPLMYSEQQVQKEKIGWHRVGENICYYKNQYTTNSKLHNKPKHYHTLTFLISFLYDNDVCYFAPSYPYSFSTLQFSKNTICIP